MNQNLKTFKVTYLKNEKVLYWTEQSTETVLIEAKCSFDARIKAWELPGCVVVTSIKDVAENKKNSCSLIARLKKFLFN
jgi:hypothetical protein